MAKTRLKILKVNNQSSRVFEDCYSEYMVYCKSIGQRVAILESKKRFYKYELLKKIKADDKISAINQKAVEGWINKFIDERIFHAISEISNTSKDDDVGFLIIDDTLSKKGYFYKTYRRFRFS